MCVRVHIEVVDSHYYMLMCVLELLPTRMTILLLIKYYEGIIMCFCWSDVDAESSWIYGTPNLCRHIFMQPAKARDGKGVRESKEN